MGYVIRVDTRQRAISDLIQEIREHRCTYRDSRVSRCRSIDDATFIFN